MAIVSITSLRGHYTQNPVNLIVSLNPPHVQRGSGVLSDIDVTYYDQERKGLMKLPYITKAKELKFPVSQTIFTKFSLM